jgi:mannose-6-phosphate isomerase-like protein (cupin superfamily)
MFSFKTTLILLLSGSVVATAEPAPKVVKLDAQGRGHLAILTGPPETATMRSGLVVLEPGKTVGKHNTGANEELLVVMEGTGEFRIQDGENLPLVGGTALYCPVNRTHDVFNTGKTTLRYVYITASTRVMPTQPGLAH